MINFNFSRYVVNSRRWDEAAPRKKGARGRPTYCEAEGCSRCTHGGKFYCTEHVEMAEHATWVLGELERKKRELAHVASGGKPSVSDHLSDEIRRALLRTPSTVGLLSRVLSEPPEVIDAYCYALEASGVVVLEKLRRGSNVVRLAG